MNAAFSRQAVDKKEELNQHMSFHTLNMDGKDYVFRGTPAQFVAFVGNFADRLNRAAPIPHYIPMNVPPAFRRTLPNGDIVSTRDASWLPESELLTAKIEYEVPYPIHADPGHWRPGQGHIDVVSMGPSSSLVTVWTSQDRSSDKEREHILLVWERLRSELNKLQLLEQGELPSRTDLHLKSRETLWRMMSERFVEGDIRDICLIIGVDYENLEGDAKKDKVRELVLLCERDAKLPELIAVCQEMRERVDWPEPW